MSSRIILVKNVSNTNTYRILGVPIAPNSQLSFTSYSFAGLADSSALRNGVAAGDLIVSDGVVDYNALDGIAYIVNQVSTNPIFIGHEGMRFPYGTTAERPQTPLNGTIRLNTSTTQLEFFLGNEWRNIISIPAAPDQKVLDRIEDKDGNTFVDVDSDDTGLVDHINFHTHGRQAVVISNDARVTLYAQEDNEPILSLLSSGDGAVRLSTSPISDDVRFTFPASEGVPNQVLTTDGQGQTFWSTPVSNAIITKNYLDTVIIPAGADKLSGKWNTAFLENVNNKYANNVINQFPLYGERCFFDAQILPSGNTQIGLAFADLNELFAWANTNLQSDFIPGNPNRDIVSDSALIRPYDEMDSSIPVLDKVRGFNRAFSSIKGGGNYLKRVSTALGTRGWDFAETFLNMFLYTYPNVASIQSFQNPLLFEKDDYKSTVWVCQNYKTFYGIAKPGDTVDGGNGVRYALNNTNTPVIPVDGTFILGKPVVMSWEGADKNDSKIFYHFVHQAEANQRANIESQSPGSTAGWVSIGPNSEQEVRRRLMRDNRSSVLVYPATNSEGLRAVYVKPLGIDTIYTNWVDFSQYWLEAVFFGPDVSSYKFQDIPESEIYRARQNYDDMAFNIQNFTFSRIRPERGSHHGGWNEPYKCYFRLRDRNTRRVGGLSKGYVSATFSGRYNPLMYMTYADK